MNKKLFYFAAILVSSFTYSQQNSEFREVKEYYDYQRTALEEAFRKEIVKPQNAEVIPVIQKDYTEFMQKMDSLQNVALIGALIRVRNREDLTLASKVINKKDFTDDSIKSKEFPAEYPGGMDVLRNQVAHLFYFDAHLPENSTVAANISFVVERDGSISSVRAEGSNFVFNRQAEIAVYMLPEKFRPATIGGEKVRYRFRVPLSMKFD